MWQLIFLFTTIMNILGIIYPFLIKFDMRFNILKLKGTMSIKFFNKLKLELKFRIKNGYVYFYFNKKEKKEKISKKNINLIFIFNLTKHLYFRQQWLSFELKSNFGYVLDSCVTATACGFIEAVSKSVLCKIKNNKKSAHIFVDAEPKYNEDICNLRMVNEIRMSVADIIYAFVYAIIYTRRNNEKSRKCRT